MVFFLKPRSFVGEISKNWFEAGVLLEKRQFLIRSLEIKFF